MMITVPCGPAFPPRSALVPVFIALAVLAGCNGQIGRAEGSGNGSPGSSSGGPGTTGPSTGSGSGTGGSSTGGMPLDCTARQAPALHARLLTPSQYNNTVSDLVKVGGDPSRDFGGGVAAQLDDL